MSSKIHKVVIENSVHLNSQPRVVNSLIIQENHSCFFRVELGAEKGILRTFNRCDKGTSVIWQITNSSHFIEVFKACVTFKSSRVYTPVVRVVSHVVVLEEEGFILEPAIHSCISGILDELHLKRSMIKFKALHDIPAAISHI